MTRSHLAALLLLAAVVAAPMTGSAQEADGEHRMEWGVHATFTSTDRCVVTTAPIQAYVRHGQAAQAFLDIDNLEVVGCRDGRLLDARLSTTEFALDIDPRLEWATLRGIATSDFCTGPRCPATPFSLTIELTWTATGLIERDHFQNHVDAEVEIRNGAQSGVSRAAVASGMLTDGTTNYALNPSSDAGISSVVFASTLVTPG